LKSGEKRQAVQTVNASRFTSIKNHAQAGLQHPDFYVLLDDQLLTPSALAAHMKMPPSTVTRVLDRFESRGFVRRTANGADRRSIRIVPNNKIAGYAGTTTRIKGYESALPERRRKPAGARRAHAR
jgi:hypothetical protein